MIFERSFWSDRLKEFPDEPHKAVRCCSYTQRQEYHALLSDLLSRYVKPSDSILDAGCGIGLLLDCLSKGKHDFSKYVGIDTSPDFVAIARKEYPRYKFLVGDLRDELKDLQGQSFDLAVCSDFKFMVVDNAGQEMWQHIENNLFKMAPRILVTEASMDVNKCWMLTSELIERP